MRIGFSFFQLRDGFPEDAVRLAAGAANSEIERGDVRGFDVSTAAQTPEGPADFFDDGFFPCILSVEDSAKFRAQLSIEGFFAGVREGAGEKTEFDGIAG